MSNHHKSYGESIQNVPDVLVRGLRSGLARDYSRAKKSSRTPGRQKEFQVDTARRRLVQIETMIADFGRTASALESEILGEENRARLHDPAHYAYPTYAKATTTRRDNLNRSVDGLKSLLDDAKCALTQALFEVEEVGDLRTMPAELVNSPRFGT